jgi:hypothetical protein
MSLAADAATAPHRVSNTEPAQATFAPISLAVRERAVIAERILSMLPRLGVTILPASDKVSAEEVRRVFPEGPVFVCDLHITGIENGESLPYGYRLNGITNIDHHAPTKKMEGLISSGILAARYVREHGPVPPEVPVAVHHTDCDSVVSSLMLRGILPSDRFFEDAVIAADHTGGEHPVADLLQALDPARNIEFSARNLARLLLGENLEPEAERLMSRRRDERAECERIKAEGDYREIGKLVLIEADRQISGEFLPPLFPGAALILVTRPAPKGPPGVWFNKLRLGLAAPEGFSLNDLDLRSLDPVFGGRWNAGANNRGGGTTIEPGEYARIVSVRLESALAKD